MNNIEWKDGAVCYAMDMQWCERGTQLLSQHNTLLPYDGIIDIKDFKLNEIRTGDFIQASELDSEQKYNEVVEVFGLFGVDGGFTKGSVDYNSFKNLLESHCHSKAVIHEVERGLCFGVVMKDFDYFCKRQLTYSQIIAIGKLKRMVLGRENAAPKTNSKDTDQVKNPKHYQLVDGVESIEIIARSMTQEQFKGYCLGNMLKYRLRTGKKDALQQDIDKANFYGELYEMHKEKCYD